MKNSVASSVELEVRIEKVCRNLLLSVSSRNILVHESCPYTTRRDDNRLPVGQKFLSKKYRDYIGYLILLHFYPVDEKHLCYLYLDLQEHIEKDSDSFWLSVLIEHKEYFLKWLERQQTMTEGEFFGSICNEKDLSRLMKTIVIQFEETFRCPKRVVRRKGYKDKGSRQDDSVRAIIQEETGDFILTLLQLEIEMNREIRQKEIILFRNYITGERGLTDEYLVKFKIISRPKEGQKHDK